MHACHVLSGKGFESDLLIFIILCDQFHPKFMLSIPCVLTIYCIVIAGNHGRADYQIKQSSALSPTYVSSES